MEFLRKKLKWIQQTMREQGIDLWITFTREGNEDPLAQDLRFSDLTWRSAAIIDQDDTNNRKKEAEEHRRQLKLRRRRCRWYNERHGSISQTGTEGIFQTVRLREDLAIALRARLV